MNPGRRPPEVWGIVVAGGTGTRFGGPKQFERLGDRRVLDWAIAAASRASTGVVLVVPADRVTDATTRADVVIPGGATRSASVRAGLDAVPPDAAVVVVHDAARPLARVALFDAVVAAVLDGADGAVAAVPVTDTVKRVTPDGTGAGVVVATVDRRDLVAVQTPQAFRAGVLRRAHRDAPDATDDAALVEAIGGRVVVVEGDHRNRKITTADDLVAARALVAATAGARR